MRKIITTSGQEIPLSRPHTTAEIRQLIGARDGLDTVRLADGLVMLVDDLGHLAGLPRNEKATALYLGRCRPGTTHYIVGDVAIVPDADFGRHG